MIASKIDSPERKNSPEPVNSPEPTNSPEQINNTHSLWHLTQGQRARYSAAFLSMAMASLLMFAAPLIGGYAIDALNDELAEKSSGTGFLYLSALAIVLLTTVGGYFLYLRGRLSAVASEKIVKNLREKLYHQLHHLQSSFYDETDTGDLVQRCSSDVETVRVFLSADIVEIGRAIILFITLLPFLFYMDTSLAWLSICLMPILLIFAVFFFTKVKSLFLITDESEAKMTAVLQENLTGIRVIRAFARQEYEIDKFSKHNKAFRDHNNRLIKLLGVYWALSDFFSMCQIGLVLIAGGFWLMDGKISVGTLFTFLTCVSMVIWPIRHLGRVLTDAGKAVVSLKRINEILGKEKESCEGKPPVQHAKGAIRFENIHFEYQPGLTVIEGFSIEIGAGETLAIVGPPGSGKSTLIRLLLRLYEPQSGAIFLDKQDISGLSRQWLREQVAVVLQDPFLYTRSIHDNLLVGRPEADSEAVTAAAEDAAVHHSIQSFPKGYASMVGERGVTLSGGQRQRLALARALLKDPAILVLDDSLSAVDIATEQQILKRLIARKGRHTTIMIAHRLSSIMHADRILVLDKGRCVQLGNHASLSKQTGMYQRLCQIQLELDAQISKELHPPGSNSNNTDSAYAAKDKKGGGA